MPPILSGMFKVTHIEVNSSNTDVYYINDTNKGFYCRIGNLIHINLEISTFVVEQTQCNTSVYCGLPISRNIPFTNEDEIIGIVIATCDNLISIGYVKPVIGEIYKVELFLNNIEKGMWKLNSIINYVMN